ncbi:MAG: bifunctional lysylphosphatidylglycerol flippase/synthetase MprF [bacterium]|nr:bifunctional lysylphosphatidylglycerol flippase/synthetase MprF [bacterium]
MTRRLEQAGTALSVGLFALVLLLLHHELRQYHWHEIVAEVRAVPWARFALALAAGAVSYVLLTGYDVLALRWIRRPLPYRRTAFASFVAYVVSHNIGPAFLGASAIRLRLYGAFGLSAADIGAVVVFTSLTFWMGFLPIAGVALLLEGLPGSVVPLVASRVLGTVLLLAFVLYLGACAVVRAPLRWRTYELRLPSLRMAAAQVVLSCADWIAAAAVLWVLLPAGVAPSFMALLGAFVLAQLAGLLSHVPGGLGVFESSLLFLLGDAAASPAVLASLVVYRVAYYLIPLAVGVLLLGIHEARPYAGAVRRVGGALGTAASALVPPTLAAATFMVGAVLVATGALPTTHGRLEVLGAHVPLPVVELSHLAASVVGVLLMLLARGLQQRLDVAWSLTVGLLAAGVVTALLRALDWETALALALVLGALLPCHRRFHRRAALRAETLTRPWLVAVALVVVGTGWLLLVAWRHVEYAHDLWWQFAFDAGASRALRASVAAAMTLLVWGGLRLLRPAGMPAPVAAADEAERVRAVVRTSRAPDAHLALLGDKRFCWNERGDGFVMYAASGRTLVAMGDPVAPRGDARELAWRFRDLCDRHGALPAFYEVGPALLPVYLELGLALQKLGEFARVDLAAFGLEGGARKSLRTTYNRLRRDGCTFEIVAPDAVPALLPALREVSDAWLTSKRTREKSFSLGRFDERYLAQLPHALVHHQGRLVAFATLWQGADRHEVSVDLMRHRPDGPPSLMDFLFTELLLWAKADGWRWFAFGMAPLSGLEARRLAPLWTRAGAYLFRHGAQVYNFQGLRQYKEKFDPVWEPRYLASPGGLALPRVLTDVATLVSGGITGVVAR